MRGETRWSVGAALEDHHLSRPRPRRLARSRCDHFTDGANDVRAAVPGPQAILGLDACFGQLQASRFCDVSTPDKPPKRPRIVREEETRGAPGKQPRTCPHCGQPVGAPHHPSCPLAFH
jgi:hypothetical protein